MTGDRLQVTGNKLQVARRCDPPSSTPHNLSSSPVPCNLSPRKEAGYTLAVVMVFTSVLLVTLSGAVINWQKGDAARTRGRTDLSREAVHARR